MLTNRSYGSRFSARRWVGVLAVGLFSTISVSHASPSHLAIAGGESPSALVGSAPLMEIADTVGSVTNPAPVERRKTLDPFVFTDAEGVELNSTDLKGRVVVVNFWATWCGPCVAEMPSLDQLQADLGGEDLLVLALSQDRGGAFQVQRFYEETGISHLPMRFDPLMAAGRKLGVRGLPTTFIMDREGRLAAFHEGFEDWGRPAVRAAIEQLMTEETVGG